MRELIGSEISTGMVASVICRAVHFMDTAVSTNRILAAIWQDS
jgi:hypothetical protein